MAALSQPTGYPDLLVATGTDLAVPVDTTDNTGTAGTYEQVVPVWRQTLKDLLFSTANGVRSFRGAVDFVVCYVARGLQPNFAGSDHSVTIRPFRGIAQLPGHYDLAADLPARLGERLGGVAHEVCHYWLVPGSATIRTESGPVPLPSSEEVGRALWSGQGMPRYPIIGRQGRHWSP